MPGQKTGKNGLYGMGTTRMDGYRFVCIQYQDAAPEDRYYREVLHPRELEKIARAAEKRRCEFLFGRLCAKSAYAALTGCERPLHSLLIQSDSAGAPFFEDGAVDVGITHDSGLAAALVTEKTALPAAVDVLKITEKNAEVITRYIREQEKQLLKTLTAKYGGQIDETSLCAAFWVAKESMSKLLGYGFAVFDALELSGIEFEREITVCFKNFRGFGTRVRRCGDYLFGFSARRKDLDAFGQARLAIEMRPAPALAALSVPS